MYMYPRITRGKTQNAIDMGAKQYRKVCGIDWMNDDKLMGCQGAKISLEISMPFDWQIT